LKLLSTLSLQANQLTGTHITARANAVLQEDIRYVMQHL
jgi:hypothetical protein